MKKNSFTKIILITFFVFSGCNLNITNTPENVKTPDITSKIMQTKNSPPVNENNQPKIDKPIYDIRNTQRKTGLNVWLSAISQYRIDNRGKMPPNIIDTWTNVDNNTCLDLCKALIPTYMTVIKIDPMGTDKHPNPHGDNCDDFDTAYEIRAQGNTVQMRALGTEGSMDIIQIQR